MLEIPDDEIDAHLPDPASLEQLRYLTASDIMNAIAALPIEFRFVVYLEVEGFSEAEMADILRCPAGTVKSRLSRAKAKLRRRKSERARRDHGPTVRRNIRAGKFRRRGRGFYSRDPD